MDGVQLRSRMTGMEGQKSGQTEGARKGISGSTIKIIAVTAMLIDHIGAAVLTRQLMADGLGSVMERGSVEEMMSWMMAHGAIYITYTMLRLIGRLGFPIFCFLLVEGFQKTRDVRKYAMRLGLFALLSEIPFDLAMRGSPFDFGYQNVYFTLFLGLFTLCAFEFFAKYRNASESRLWMLPMILGVLFAATYGAICVMKVLNLRTTESILAALGVLCVAAALGLVFYKSRKGLKRAQIAGADMMVLVLIMYLADLLCTDYGGMGVLTIIAMYIFRKNKVLSVTAGCVVLTVMSVSEITAFFVLIPIALYNGKRGLKMKYFFYAFYPVHLFLLYVVSVLMGLGDVSMF